MVQRVDRAQRELDVALGIDVVGDAEGDFGEVLHVAIFIHNHNAFSEHGLPQRPDSGHDFPSLARITLADGDDHQVMEDAFDG